jgi:ubiquinone/menaquinone biosynthesis C-methylase UbiE
MTKEINTPPVCDYEGSDYQDKFWKEGGRAYEDGAEVLALKRLLPVGGKHLLELGAGAGRNTPRYQGFERVTLLDYSTTQLQQAIQYLGSDQRYRFVAADVYRLPFAPRAFDAATMIRTLHHLSEPNIAIAQLRECLADNAVFILEFANKRNLKSILRYWLGKQDWSPFTPEAVEFVELNFDFHPASVRKMLTENGFHLDKEISVSFLRAAFFKRVMPLGLMLAKENFLQRGFSWAAISPSIFLRSTAFPQGQEALDMQTEAFFRCPACGHYPLADTPPELKCEQCGQTYEFKDGIYDFRLK